MDNVLLVDDASTISEYQGFFKYKTLSIYFSVGSSYDAIFNCTSPSRDKSGLAKSRVYITGDDPASIDTNSVIGDLINIVNPTTPINWVLGLPTSGDFWDQTFDYTTMVDNLRTSLLPEFIVDVVDYILNPEDGILITTWTIIKTLFNLGYTLLTDPYLFIEKVITYNWKFLFMIASIFFIPFMLYETWVIIHASGSNNFEDMVTVFFRMNGSLLNFIYNALNMVVNFGATILNMFISLLSTIRQMFQF